MAAPSVDTTPAKLALVSLPENRGSGPFEDAQLINVFAEKMSDGVRVCKRPGYENRGMASGSGVGLGIYRRDLELFELRGGFALLNGVAIGPINADFPYWWNQTLGAPEYVYFDNGDHAYTYNGVAPVVEVTDPDFPPNRVHGSAYLDGTLYVMTRDARIHGSAINNPTSWSATNVIVAQIAPDKGIALAKSLIYVVALKQYSTEFFYDANNPTGSPLLPVPNAKIAYGCRDGLSVQEIDDMILYVATTREGGNLIGKIEKLKFSRVSTPSIDRLLDNLVVLNSYSARLEGHTFYFITMSNLQTFAYDVYEDFWFKWDGIETIHQASGVAGPIVNLFQTTAGEIVMVDIFNPAGWDDLTGIGKTAIGIDVITPNFDGDTRLTKVLSKMRIVTDQRRAGTLAVRWSDDDYKTWSGWEIVNLENDAPMLTNLGSFKKRAFWFRHETQSAPFRLEPMELELMVGSI